MFLSLGIAPPSDVSQTLIVIEIYGLKDSITIVDSLPSNYFIRGRTPALQIEDTIIFGVKPICNYLFSKAVMNKDLSIEQIEQLIKKDERQQNVNKIIQKYINRDGRSAAKVLTQAFRDAISRAFPLCYNEDTTIIEVKFDGRKLNGIVIDYSFSGTQQLMNQFKKYPSFTITSSKDMAEAIVSFLDLEKLNWIISKVEIAGFYINIYLSKEFLQSRIDLCSSIETSSKQRLPAPPILKPSRIVIDFSSPNIAKEMHVGHLRSTIIGDSLCRFFEYAGNTVFRVNHVGDWGTQFGMLLQFLKEREEKSGQDTFEFLNQLSLTDLTKLYKQSKVAFDADVDGSEFKDRARKMVVALQSGKDLHARKVWEKLVEVSKEGFETIYSRLNISFENNNNSQLGTGYCGESFYQDKIEDTIKSLGRLVQKRGDALLLFTNLKEAKQEPTAEHPDGEIPLFLRKSDGGFGYDSTDIAAVRFRIQQLKADRILYVTDSGQQSHFHLIFEAARLAGWTLHTKLDHVKFGVVLEKGGGKFKTRSGETVPLISLLESAKMKMKQILLEKMKKENSKTDQFTEMEIEERSQATGCAAIKYFDLRNNRTKDYEYDEESMCSPDGDTAIYLLFAYARVCSIIHIAKEVRIKQTKGYVLNEQSSDRERALAITLSRFNEVMDLSLASLTPHPLCGYLYSLASELSTFLTEERVWNKREADSSEAPTLETARGLHRLFLVRAVRSVLYEGLNLLGITPFDRM